MTTHLDHAIMPVFAVGFVRVSTGSQDEKSQIREIKAWAAEHGVTVIHWVKLHGYPASSGTQEPALREVIAGIHRGDWTKVIVTDSSRLDRRENIYDQVQILIDINRAGGEVVSLTEPHFGKTDQVGFLVTTIAQFANAEKSRTVKDGTFRGIKSIAENGGYFGVPQPFWSTRGARYSKQAFCTDPAAVRAIYDRIAGGETVASVARAYDLFPQQVKGLVMFPAHHTGVIECRYTHDIEGEIRWTHEVTPVVDSALWWRAVKRVTRRENRPRASKGGRPVAKPERWITGLLACPGCGGRLYVNGGLTPSGRPRTPKLRCAGPTGKQRLECGKFPGCDARPVMDVLDNMFATDRTPVMAYQRIAGNAHELEELNARLAKVQSLLSITHDDDELDTLVATRKTLKAQIAGFTVTPDRYDYAPTGQTVAGVWADADTEGKRRIVRAVRAAWGMELTRAPGAWGVVTGTAYDGDGDATGVVVNLGGGLCFRREAALAA